MTWAARYSATDEPELTIYRDGKPFAWVHTDRAEKVLGMMECDCDSSAQLAWIHAAAHTPDLRADIAARVDLRECEETQACTRHAMPGGRCREHGGRDEL